MKKGDLFTYEGVEYKATEVNGNTVKGVQNVSENKTVSEPLFGDENTEPEEVEVSRQRRVTVLISDIES